MDYSDLIKSRMMSLSIWMSYPVVRNNMDLQTTGATTKRIGNTNWCQYGLCQPMKSEAKRLRCLDTTEVPDDYFKGYY